MIAQCRQLKGSGQDLQLLLNKYMSKQFQVFFSNRTELLYERLKRALFSSTTTPFTRRLVIVPSQPMKAWLLLKMANDPELGIATGIEISYLDPSLKKLHRTLFPELIKEVEEQKRLSPLELALAIESEIRAILPQLNAAKLNLSECGQTSIWQPLIHYLKISAIPGEHLSQKTERRLAAISDKLALLFSQYGNCAGEMVSKWETELKVAENWQQQLWCNLRSQWSYPYAEYAHLLEPFSEQLASNSTNRGNVQLHLFSMSYIPKLQHLLCLRFAECIPVHYYLLSPCQMFWSDVHSDYESRSIQAYWKQRGVSESQQEDLEEYLRDRNPLLANFGRLGREMALQIEESEAESHEDYVLLDATTGYSQYQELFSSDDLVLVDKGEPLTLLTAIQADLVLLRNPDDLQKNQNDELVKIPKIEFTGCDHSIQVHIASSKMREVQILYDAILGIIDLRNRVSSHVNQVQALYPNEIIVMAPDISIYAPFIKAVFGKRESVLEAQIFDLKVPAQSVFIQGFLHLLSLPFSRWDVSAILQLLDYPAFQRKHHFKLEEVRELQDWTKAAGVRWGTDHLQRNELLQRDHCSRGMVEDSQIGTWEHAFERLLLGLSMSTGDSEMAGAELAVMPLECVDFTRAELLGKWICLLRSLKADLKALNDHSYKTLGAWSLYLRCLLETYFSIDSDSFEEKESHKILLAQIDAFQQAFLKLKASDQKFAFFTIKRHLESALDQQSCSYHEQCLHAVRFCSMLPMRAIPAKVVALLGMEEGAFPKQESNRSLNLMQGNKLADYCPRQTDYDRFLFLEVLLSARSHIFMTYQGYSARDGKEQPPSLLITELLAYLDRAFTVSGGKPSQHCLQRHPFHAFDKGYFELNKSQFLQSYSQSAFLAAQAYYQDGKILPHRFVPEFKISPDLEDQRFCDNFCGENRPLSSKSREVCIALKDLAGFARNPLKTYFNKTLGVYLEKAEDRIIKNEEDFHLSALQSFQLKKMALTQPVDLIIKLAEKQGDLPLGAFKWIAIDKLKAEVVALKNNLIDFEVNPQDIFEIEFSEHCRAPIQTSQGHWNVPALKIAYRDSIQIKITGKLSEVSPQGLIAHLKDDKIDAVKIWPQFLVLSCLIKNYQLPISAKLLLIKTAKGKAKESFWSDPEELLRHYLDYYFLGLENLSPLIPEWVPSLLAEERGAFSEKMQSSLSNPFQPLYNDYMQWLTQAGTLPDSTSIELHWQEIARNLYSQMYQNWFKA